MATAVKSIQSLGERPGNEVESSDVYYANDVLIHSLNIQHENERGRTLANAVNDATCLNDNYTEHSSDEDQWYTEEQKKRLRSKLHDNDRRGRNLDDTGYTATTSTARFVWTNREVKQSQANDDEKGIELQRNESLRSCGGELTKDGKRSEDCFSCSKTIAYVFERL